MWTRCGSRISLRPPEVAPVTAPLRRRAVPFDAPPGRRWPARWNDRCWCSAARSRRSWSTGPPCAGGTWSWRGVAAGEGLSISSPGTSCGSTPGSRRDDPLWLLDVSAAAEWVGTWWIDALGGLGPQRLRRSTAGRAVPGELGDLVCFAGRGPGEVFHGERKVVGLSQWRCPGGRPVLLLRVPPLEPRAAAGADRTWTQHVRDGLTRDLAPVGGRPGRARPAGRRPRSRAGPAARLVPGVHWRPCPRWGATGLSATRRPASSLVLLQVRSPSSSLSLVSFVGSR